MQDKFLGMTPPLGWNSWNTFTWNINDQLIRESADAMVESGLKDAGYEYVVIDDCWSLKQRDEKGYLVPDPEKFPQGMKAVGGVGNGIFECVQELVGYESLCYLRMDDPELYADIFRKVGQTNLQIWTRFLETYGDIFCVCRFGDDLGFKSNTLLIADDIRQLVIPAYRAIIDQVHLAGKPFLLHSCGCIFEVMDDLIRDAGIDAKHSNEDVIAPFPVWVERYGDRIGNFGGIDTDAVCRLDGKEMERYIEDVVRKSRGHGGFAFGSGNSIPNYVPVDQFRKMNRIIREIRGE